MKAEIWWTLCKYVITRSLTGEPRQARADYRGHGQRSTGSDR